MSEEPYDITDSLLASVDFTYPLDDNISEGADDDDARYYEFITKFTSYLLTNKNPQLILSALLYTLGTDVGIIFGCPNTETSIARILGTSKQKFSQQVKEVRKQFDIKYSNTGKNESAKKIYGQYNKRKI